MKYTHIFSPFTNATTLKRGHKCGLELRVSQGVQERVNSGVEVAHEYGERVPVLVDLNASQLAVEHDVEWRPAYEVGDQYVAHSDEQFVFLALPR